MARLNDEQFRELSARANAAIRNLSASDTLVWYRENRDIQIALDEYNAEHLTAGQQAIADPNASQRPR